MSSSATCDGIASKTSEKQPASWSASASRATRAAAGGVAALGAVAAERRRGLRRQADVAHDRDPRLHDRPRPRGGRRPAAFELDGVAAGLLDEAQRGAHGLLVGDLVGAERQVADEKRRAQAAAHGLGEHEQLVGLDGDGRRVAEHGHRAGVADEHHVDARGLDGARAREVVGGDHDDRLAEALHLGEAGEGDRAGGPSWPRPRSGWGGWTSAGLLEVSSVATCAVDVDDRVRLRSHVHDASARRRASSARSYCA